MIDEYNRIINNLSYQNYNLSSSLSSYNDLKSQLAGLVSKLRKESNNLDNFANKVGAYYSVDNISIGDRVKDNKEDVDSVILYINGIISGIESKTSDINRKVDNNNNSIWYYRNKIRELKDKGEK